MKVYYLLKSVIFLGGSGGGGGWGLSGYGLNGHFITGLLSIQ